MRLNEMTKRLRRDEVRLDQKRDEKPRDDMKGDKIIE